MRLFFSGGSEIAETTLAYEHADIMPSYWLTVYNTGNRKPSTRIRKLISTVKKRKAEKRGNRQR